MKFRILSALSVIMLGFVLFNACKKEEEPFTLENLDKLEITPANALVLPGKTEQLTATAYFKDGSNQNVTGKVTWKSSNTAVTTVDTKGRAKGLKIGEVTISASAGKDKATSKLSVVSEADLERLTAINDYINNYLGSENPDPGWTGNVTGCIPGSINPAAYDKVIQRINYFRRLVGVHDNITLKQEYNSKCQEAALMFRANNTITHYPPASWTCYTANGNEAAGKSNIAFGLHSVNAITAYIDDFGAHNKPVGHRRWLLYTKANAMGEGSTPNTNATWIWDWLPSAPAGTPEFIAYPTNGYMPAPLVFDRWSFSIPNASFNNAQVIMTGPSGSPVNLTVVDATTTGAGDNTIVWEPKNINTTSNTDVKYTVTINNIIGAPKGSYTYDVVIVRPMLTQVKTGYEMERERNPNIRVE